MNIFKTHEIYDQLKIYLPPNPTILEAGAFDGRDTQKLVAAFPQSTIHAFEPVPDCFALLEQNTKHLKNVHRYQMALSDRNGTAPFHVAQKPNKPGKPIQAGSLHAPKERTKWSSIEYPHTINVHTITIDSWITENNIEKVDFMWLDMQGHELHALKGAHKTLQNTSVLYVEVNFIPAYENQPTYQEVINWIEKQGFKEVGRNFATMTDWFFGNILFIKK